MNSSPRRSFRILLAAASLAGFSASVSAQNNLTWNLATGGTWNTSTANWTGDATTFATGDFVTFNNTAGGTILIPAAVSPGGTTVSAASGAYTFSGGPIDSGFLTKSGSGSLTISNNHSYTGVTTINSNGATGSLTTNVALQDGGVNSPIGASSSAAANLVISGSTGTGTTTGLIINAVSTTNRLFTIGSSASIRANQATSFTNTGAIAFSTVNTASAFNLSTANTTLSFSPQITNNGTGVVGLTTSTGNTGSMTLANTANSYTGVTNFAAGNGQTMVLTKLANGGQNSSIGASTNIADNFQMTGGTTVRYTGGGDSSDRNYRINGNSVKNVTWEASGTGALTLSGTATYANVANPANFTLGGTSASNIVNTYNGLIDKSGTQVTAIITFVKTGSNTWALGGNNTYTGTTSVNQGTLLINGNQSAATGAVSVAGGATLGGSGTVGGATTIADLGILAPGNSPGILSFSSNLTLGGADTKINFEISSGTRGTNYDGVNVGGLLTYNGDLTLTINSGIGNTVYNLFDLGSESGTFSSIAFGGTGPYSGGFTLDSPGVWLASSGSQSFSFSEVTGDLTVTAIPEPSVCFLVLGAIGVLQLRRRRAV